jgi:hypothetical protein
MKTLFALIVAFLLVFFLGCQENAVTEPVFPLEKNDKPVTEQYMKICCELLDPQFGLCNLTGCVTYIHQIMNYSPNTTGLYEISLSLEMDSELCDKLGMYHLEWNIKGRSKDIVYVSEDGIAIVEKSYWITNRNDEMLLVQYLVTTNGVGIANLSLVEIEK